MAQENCLRSFSFSSFPVLRPGKAKGNQGMPGKTLFLYKIFKHKKRGPGNAQGKGNSFVYVFFRSLFCESGKTICLFVLVAIILCLLFVGGSHIIILRREPW